ncbi:putative sulfate/molybdate transporter [Marimonas lutisalis]|uniref:putative sulfate/molybdate transporter n=1 Tax=Marimonas lutisalis TaxID=2545756 RepID=UPI0010FA50AA|nr:putative sulfate/molybdate transporter [Marimonas lutisalis]
MTTQPYRFTLREAGGALGDLGTLLPLTLAAITVAGLSATMVFLGFGLFYVATGLIYRLPIPVQPMKAVAAVILVAGVSPASVALSGLAIGLILIALGGSGAIDRLGRLVPQSVMVGLQLGLGLGLGWVALGLMRGALLVGGLSLAVAVVFLLRRGHAALATLATGLGLGVLLGAPGLSLAPSGAPAMWFAQAITADDIRIALSDLALPQMALTLTNAVLLTALVARDRFGDRAAHVTPRRLCLTSGLGNLLFAPLGALPMCHGAGGVAAHYRFGARSGAAPIMIGAVLIGVAVLPGDWRAAFFAAIPMATLGALLLVAACELAISRRLFDCNASCRPVIAATAAATVLVNPLIGLFAGTVAEIVRKAIVRRQRA